MTLIIVVMMENYIMLLQTIDIMGDIKISEFDFPGISINGDVTNPIR